MSTRWLVILPLKPRGKRKTRLAAWLDAEARDTLTDAMFDHAVAIASDLPEIELVLLSPQRPAKWTGKWRADEAPLNVMLDRLREESEDIGFAVVNPDLPYLTSDDLHALFLAASTAGVAIAVDRSGVGTNAVAVLPGQQLKFVFGTDSAARFRSQYPDRMQIVVRTGLALDIDEVADLLEFHQTAAMP